MEQHSKTSSRSESQSCRSVSETTAISIITLQRYADGEISARQAAKALGQQATEHDVFAGIVATQLPLPQPTHEELVSQVTALRTLYGYNSQCL